MYNDIMRTVTMLDRSNILGYNNRVLTPFSHSNIHGYNRRVLAPFSSGNILGINTSFTHGTGDILSTVAGVGVGLGAQALANSASGRPNDMLFGQTNILSNQQMQNSFNNAQPPVGAATSNAQSPVGSAINNVQPAYGASSNVQQQSGYVPQQGNIQQQGGYIPQQGNVQQQGGYVPQQGGYNAQPQPVQQPVQQQPAPIIADKPTPTLVNKVGKGSKTNICTASTASHIKVCLGWHTSCCDVDVSAFMLGADEKSLGDEWFVFYGQPQSPDGALRLNSTESQDMQSVSVDIAKLSPNAKRIVFVLTINEALQKRQNFSMVSDAYIRIMDTMRNVEIVSFPITEYYPTITSMMVGELYLHNGNWKFNAIGNGVARDLAGLCEFYGIETI